MASKDERHNRNGAMRKAGNSLSQDASVNLSGVQNDAWRQLPQDVRDLIIKTRTEEIKKERGKMTMMMHLKLLWSTSQKQNVKMRTTHLPL